MKVTVEQHLKMCTEKIKIIQEYIDTQSRNIRDLQASKLNVSLRLFPGMSKSMIYNMIEMENILLESSVKYQQTLKSTLYSQIRFYEDQMRALKEQRAKEIQK